jgi:hypothetical protein
MFKKWFIELVDLGSNDDVRLNDETDYFLLCLCCWYHRLYI